MWFTGDLYLRRLEDLLVVIFHIGLDQSNLLKGNGAEAFAISVLGDLGTSRQ